MLRKFRFPSFLGVSDRYSPDFVSGFQPFVGFLAFFLGLRPRL